MKFKVSCDATFVINNKLSNMHPCCYAISLCIVAPVFLSPPENLTVVAPEDATFFCEATARPGPNITWWRMEGGVPVRLNDGIDYTIVEGETGERIRNSSLTVNGTEPSDAVEYFCIANNMAGMVEATAELTVHGE